MKNLDQQKEELKNSLKAAFDSGEEEQIISAIAALSENIQTGILEEANKIAFGATKDYAALAARGLKSLTEAETKYYNAIIERGVSGNVDGSAFADAETIPPPTIINRVFEDLARERELLRLINFRPAAATTEWLMRVDNKVPMAFWSDLNAPSQELMSKGFRTVQMMQNLLTCFLPVHKSMLNLGPEWLDRYVRETLAEAMAYGLEHGIVNGDGNRCPIGITRDVNDGNHPLKKAVKLTNLEPATLGNNIMKPLSRDGRRTPNNIILLVNPLDYWDKIFGATSYLNAVGEYVHGILPIPARFVLSSEMPKNHISAGAAGDYFMGAGFATGIEFSDEYRFVERQRVYKTDIVANGRPMDNDSFLLFDISELETSLKLAIKMPRK